MNDIFDLLKQNAKLSQSTCNLVKQYAQRWNISGFHALLETHIFDENSLADLLANSFKMDRVFNITNNCESAAARKAIPYDRAKAWEVYPNVSLERENWVEIFIADPSRRDNLLYLKQLFGDCVHFSVAARSEIISAIDSYYLIEEQLPFLNDLSHSKD